MSGTPRPRGRTASAWFGMLVLAVVAGVVAAAGVVPAVALAQVAATGAVGLFATLPADLQLTRLAQKTEIFATSHGKPVLIAAFYTENRDVVAGDRIAKTAKNAAVAGEDQRFFEHGGIDPHAMGRALLADATGDDLQGASTITMQYVKNVCVEEADREPSAARIQAAYAACSAPTLGRKLREMRYAIGLEQQYSKQEILLAYLNIAGFGGRIYGIESAARYYFGVSASTLSAAQAASLLAIVNDPESLRLDVAANLQANRVRRDYILAAEHRLGMISQAAYRAAVASPIRTRITPTRSGCQAAGIAGFFCDYVVRQIENSNAFGATLADREANLRTGGWKIYTTLDLDLQRSAQQTMDAQVPRTSSAFDVGASAVSVQAGTGRVLAMVQNRVFNDSGDAAALGAQYTAVNYGADEDSGGSQGFQPGSTYKVFTLLDWLAKGHALGDTVDADARTVQPGAFTQCGTAYQASSPWTVANDAAGEGGARTVQDATALSINGAYVSMAERLDLCDIRSTAEAFGVHPATGGELSDVPASVIGQASSVSPVTMAAAYAGITDAGQVCTPVAIDRIVRTDGVEVPVPGASCRQAVAPAVALTAARALRAVITTGTAAGDQTADGIAEIGKTGTTDGNAATWMIGGSTKVTTAVWVGNVTGAADLRQVWSFPYCAVTGSTQASGARHCVWRGVQAAANAIYGGAKVWPTSVDAGGVGSAVGSGGAGSGGAGSSADAGGATSTDAPSMVTVPDVVGMVQTDAEAAIQSEGLAWQLGDAAASQKPAGTVVSQSPVAGTSVIAGSSVTLRLSAGG